MNTIDMELSNTTETSSPATMETLRSLNDKEARLHMGTLCILAVMMVVGFVGNLHVLVVYALKMKSTNHRNFIVFLASLDLTLCIAGMPLTIYSLREPFIYASRVTCKLHLFIDHFICIASAFTMLVIAIERYRKICNPFGWQLSRRCANTTCLLVLVAALICAINVLFNSDTTQITSSRYPWITAKICVEVDENSAKHYTISLTIIAMILLIVLIVLYSLIWKQISSYSLPKVQTAQSTEVKTDSGVAILANDQHNSTSIAADPIGINVNVIGMSSSRQQKTKSRKLTLAFSLIAAVFFISYIPNLVYSVIMDSIDNTPNFSKSERIAITMFFYIFAYVSNTTNCFIYGFTNVKFRHEVKEMYILLFCCDQSKTPDPEVAGLNLVRGEIPSRSTHSSTLRDYSLETQEAVIGHDESKF